jgi:WS/DGAT/MGAT family acyltransferase
MNHLSGMDASFLHLETPETPMHVGGLHTLQLPNGYKGDFYEDFRQHIIDRLHISEVFTRKLALMPFEMSNPVWVEDDDVDIDYHIRRVTLPKPGTHKQLEQYVARLHSSLLDRSRPLWEFFVIDGLEDGNVALYTKVHHAGIDGQAGVALATAIMDVTPEPRKVRPPRERRRKHQYQLGMAELASAAISNALQQYVKLVRTLPDMARALQSVALPAPDADGRTIRPFGDWTMAKEFNLFGPKTMFNASITNQRAYAGRSIPLAESKQIGKRLGYSLNDVVLATCGGALRRYLIEYDQLPKKSLTAAVPVSLREQGNTDANNQVSMTMMTLATDIGDPVERLKVINASSAAAKTMIGNFKAAIPTDFPSFGAPWLMSGLASMYGRSGLANAMPPVANVAVSNVPGAQMPLYVCGALMLSYFPVSIATHGVALNITVQSYNGSLDYGLIACRRAVPDVADLADFVVEEHRRLHDAAMKRPSVAAPTEPPALAEPTAAVVDIEPAVRRKPASTAAPAKKPAAAKKDAKASAKKANKAGAAPTASRKTVRKPRTAASALH